MRYIVAIILLVGLFSCKSKNSGEKNEVVRGFYHWKSHLDLNQSQLEFLKKIRVEYLYVKFFDVVHDGYTYNPVSEINRIDDELDLNIIPTIYMTTDVFTRLDTMEIPILADNVASKIAYINGDSRIEEIQFDCDWTPSIKDKYFSFLEEIKQYFPHTKFSATVRLYQYKYPGIAGIPPVDKGLLMYYNMGDLMDYKESNSILSNEKGEQYLGFGKYPLPIDIALPNFKWSLLFRAGKFQQICPEFTSELLNDKDLFSSTKENWYTFRKDTVMYNTYFRFGDELRYEHCSEKEVIKAAKLLKEEMNQDETRVLIYDLQPNTHKDYEKINTVFSTFEQ